MTGLKFNDLEALNIEIMKHTDALNSRKMYNRSYSCRERFQEIEKDRLHTLPATRFISKSRKTATVMRNSYVSLNNHYYSVPKEYIGDTVELLYDGDTVEIYHKFRHITTHRRDDTPFTYSEKPSHKLPRVLHEYKIRMDDIYRKAREIDPAVEEYIRLVAVAKKISCSGRTFSRWYIKSCGTFRARQSSSFMPDSNGIRNVRIQRT